jgi:hypothetical protein
VIQVSSNSNLVGGFLLVDRDDVGLVGWRYRSLLDNLATDDRREADLPRLIYNPEY